jgi:chromosome segregation protein
VDKTNGQARLKSLELQGYKTFASRVDFEFSSAITAIVGPNGSGKSNIADAMRWVLGEQSYALLRGKKTEDMIYQGSESRARASMASAAITFDNSEGWLPIDFGEVTIARRAYRDGQNEYLLNGQRVRLRQVHELLSEVGLAQRTYTIIGQGLVDAVLSLRAEDRRRLFEEAAGIGLYRARREEALRRLETTERNLERVQDILAELKPRLRSLEKQAKRAEEFERVRKDLRESLRVWYGYHWSAAQRIVTASRHEAAAQSGAREQVRQRQEETDQRLADARLEIDRLRADLHRASEELTALFARREALGRRLAVAGERLRWTGDRELAVTAEVEAALEEQRDAAARLAAIEGEIADRAQALQAVQDEIDRLSRPDAWPEDAGLAAHARAEDLRGRLERSIGELAAAQARLAQAQESLTARAARIQEIDDRLRETSTRVDQLALEAELSAHRQEEKRRTLEVEADADRSLQASLAAARAGVDRLRAEAARHDQDVAARQAEADFLAKGGLDAWSLAEGLQAAGRKGELPGWVGRLLDFCTIEAEHRVAIRAALGDFAHAQLVNRPEDVEAVMRWLEADGRSGQAAALPLAVAAPPLRAPCPLDEAAIGRACDLVRSDTAHRPLLEWLLSSTWVVRDREHARRLTGDLPAGGRMVTLDGFLYYPSGAVLRRSRQDPPDARQSEAALDKARAQAAETHTRLAAAEAQMQARQIDLTQTQARRETALEELLQAEREAEQARVAAQAMQRELDLLEAQQRELIAEQARLEATVSEAQQGIIELESQRQRWTEDLQAAELASDPQRAAAHIAQLAARREGLRLASEEAAVRLEDARGRVTVADRALQVLGDRLEETRRSQLATRGEESRAAADLSVLEAELAAMTERSSPVEQSLAAVEALRTDLESQESRLRGEIQAAERRHSQSQIELARHEQELIGLRQRIEDDFGLVAFAYEDGTTGPVPLPLEGLVEELPQVDELPMEMESQVARLRLQMRRMGSVNVEAQREYLDVRQRVEFLTSQVDDLRSAETQVREVITELDALMEREFRKTFDAVAISFRQAFSRLFGGGSARLTLTDPRDLTTTGIDIEARLPGRREQGLAMLSGGERSLTACALVFALLQVSPTPFCVLDEVDAMLDESNVIRFCDMLRELSARTQFVVITHNRQTIQAAEIVYGVTMGTDSASKVMGLRLSEHESAATD